MLSSYDHSTGCKRDGKGVGASRFVDFYNVKVTVLQFIRENKKNAYELKSKKHVTQTVQQKWIGNPQEKIFANHLSEKKKKTLI